MSTKIKELERKIVRLERANERERVRTDRVVQVLVHNMPREQLNKKVSFMGRDCHGIYRDYTDSWCCDDRITLRDFLNDVIDP